MSVSTRRSESKKNAAGRAYAAPITDDERWTTGEITLISADNVRFQVSKYLLGGGSVFRDLMAIPTDDNTISFTDHDIECADVLHLFLSLSEGDFDSSTLDVTFVSVVGFLQKYDCQREIKILKAYLHNCVCPNQNDTNALVYLIASHLDDEGLCKHTMDQWKPTSANEVHRQMPYAYLRHLSMPYLYAFLETHSESPGERFKILFSDALEAAQVRIVLLLPSYLWSFC